MSPSSPALLCALAALSALRLSSPARRSLPPSPSPPPPLPPPTRRRPRTCRPTTPPRPTTWSAPTTVSGRRLARARSGLSSKACPIPLRTAHRRRRDVAQAAMVLITICVHLHRHEPAQLADRCHQIRTYLAISGWPRPSVLTDMHYCYAPVHSISSATCIPSPGRAMNIGTEKGGGSSVA